MRNSSIDELSRQVQILRRYGIGVTVLMAVLIGSIFLKGEKYKEITAERINIIESDGTLRMVLSNRTLQHPGRMDKKDLPQRDRPAGLLFF